MEIRLLSDYRDQLVVERTRMTNTLRWHLLAIDPALEASLRPSGLVGPRIRARVARRLARLVTARRSGSPKDCCEGSTRSRAKNSSSAAS